jgi:hypothetical protein
VNKAARLVGDVAILRVKPRRAGHKSGFTRRDAFTAARLVVNRSGKIPVCGFGTAVFYRTARLVVNRSSQIVGGAEKWGRYGREKGTSDVVTLWPAAGAPAPDLKWRLF